MAKKKTALRAVDDDVEDVGLPVESVDEPEEGDDAEEGVELPTEAIDSNSPEALAAATAASIPQDELDEDEQEYKRLRRDLPGVAGAAAQGIVSILVAKKPPDNAFFRTHELFRPRVPLVCIQVGMEPQFYAVTPSMEIPLHGIGINFTDHLLYLIITEDGGFRVLPVNAETDNEYTRTKEIGLLEGVKKWVRLYTDKPNTRYRVFPAPVGRFGDPNWPQLSEAKIFRLCFRDKGRLIDSTEHELFKKWAARDR